MKTRIFLLIISLGTIAFLRAQEPIPGFGWAEQIGNDSIIQPSRVAVDFEGNLIITGYFKGIADFDPGAGVLELESAGKEDIFIQKLSPEGNLLWAARMGDNRMDIGFDVVTDATGIIYLTGYFWGTIDADPGPGTYPLYQDRYTAMVLKIEPNGDLIWARQMGSGNIGHAYSYGITLDNSLNVITCGSFLGKVDFDPGPGTSYLTSTNTSNTDMYIHKLDISGNFLWVKQIAGAGFENCQSITSDGSGNIYSTGYFESTVDFNPDRKLKYNLTSFGSYDAFIEKLNGNGEFLWAKQIGGTTFDGSTSIALDNSNNPYITGYFWGTADFNPGSGTYNMTPYGGDDAFILKLTTGGEFAWAKQLGGPSWDGGSEIKLDVAGDIYVGGFFHATADFDPEYGTCYLTTEGYDDSFVYKADPEGNMLWVSQTGGTGWDYCLTLALDATGNIYNVGCFEQSADFNPDGNGTFIMANAEERDMFIQKLTPTGGSNCPVPNGLSATYNGIDALLSWNALNNSSYYIRYRETNSPEWIFIPDLISGSSYALSGLTSGTAYEFQVKTDCESNYSYSFEFITSVPECTDVYEPNESMSASAGIPINTDIIALIPTYWDKDWFHFQPTTQAKNIRITLTDLPADYNLKLYSGDGTLLGSSTNTGTTGETIIYNSNKVRIYYLIIYGFEGAYDPIECYTLHVETSATGFKSAEAEIAGPETDGCISVYPNPSSDILNIDLNSPERANVTCTLVNIAGQEVLSQQFSAAEGLNHHVVSVRNIPAGLYILHLRSASGNMHRKIMINH
jgi:hypothetical protein